MHETAATGHPALVWVQKNNRQNDYSSSIMKLEKITCIPSMGPSLKTVLLGIGSWKENVSSLS